MSDVSDRLLRLFEAGELQPVGAIPALKGFRSSTVVRWAKAGKFPAMRVGRNILSHQDLVREALLKTVINPDGEGQAAAPATTPQSTTAAGRSTTKPGRQSMREGK